MRPAKYVQYAVPTPDHQVDCDIKLLMVTGLRMKVDELDSAMWMRMTWRDPRLEICACAKNGPSIEHEQYDQTNLRAVQTNLEQ